jgi:1,3-beta-glucanosyltransferase GAS1
MLKLTFTSLSGVARHTYTFFVSTVFALLGSLLLLIAAAIWSAMISDAHAVNAFQLQRPSASPVPLGITVGTGNGLWILWAAFATLFASLLPYLVS